MPWGRFLAGTLIGTSPWDGTFGLGGYLVEEISTTSPPFSPPWVSTA
jgi:membrane protein DedA with SNARE-associated domain